MLPRGPWRAMKEVEISGGIMTGPSRNASPGFALAIHGGAGTLRRGLMDEARGALYRAGLQASLAAGHDVLAGGGSALDAVSAAVLVLEDDPLFNAGRGASFTSSGTIEMDAAVMEGRERRAGGRRHLWPKKPGSGGARRHGAFAACVAGRRRRARFLPGPGTCLRRTGLFLYREPLAGLAAHSRTAAVRSSRYGPRRG